MKNQCETPNLRAKELSKVYKEMEETLTEPHNLGDYLKQKEIGLDYNQSQETFYIIKSGKFIISFRYSLLDAYADTISERCNTDSIIVKLLENTSQIYGVDSICIMELNKSFKAYRKQILTKLPPVLQEELEKISYAEMVDPTDLGGEECQNTSWKDGKTKEEIEKIEKKFRKLEEDANNDANFMKVGNKLVYVSKNEREEVKEEVENEKTEE